MTKNRAPTPVYLDPGMHPGLEVKGLMAAAAILFLTDSSQKLIRSSEISRKQPY